MRKYKKHTILVDFLLKIIYNVYINNRCHEANEELDKDYYVVRLGSSSGKWNAINSLFLDARGNRDIGTLPDNDACRQRHKSIDLVDESLGKRK